MDRLVKLVERLRSDNGCPWDREQTIHSMKPCLLEEAYELFDALTAEDGRAVEEEMGDLLFVIAFLSVLAQDKWQVRLDSAIDKAAQKMVKRHPHVFADVKVKDSQEVLANWKRIKETEIPSAQFKKKAFAHSFPAAYRLVERFKEENRPESIIERVRTLSQILASWSELENKTEQGIKTLLFDLLRLAGVLCAFYGFDLESAMEELVLS